MRLILKIWATCPSTTVDPSVPVVLNERPEGVEMVMWVMGVSRSSSACAMRRARSAEKASFCACHSSSVTAAPSFCASSNAAFACASASSAAFFASRASQVLRWQISSFILMPMTMRPIFVSAAAAAAVVSFACAMLIESIFVCCLFEGDLIKGVIRSFNFYRLL